MLNPEFWERRKSYISLVKEIKSLAETLEAKQDSTTFTDDDIEELGNAHCILRELSQKITTRNS